MTGRPPISTLFPPPPLSRSAGSPRPLGSPLGHEGIVPAASSAYQEIIRLGFPRLPAFHCADRGRSEEHTSELQSQSNLVCRLLLEKKKKIRLENHIRVSATL